MGSQTRGMAPQPGPSLLAAAVTVLELSAQGGQGVSGSPLFPHNGHFHNCCHKGSSLRILTLPASSVPLQHVHSSPRITAERIQTSFLRRPSIIQKHPPICESFPDSDQSSVTGPLLAGGSSPTKSEDPGLLCQADWEATKHCELNGCLTKLLDVIWPVLAEEAQGEKAASTVT